ncbi:(2Fe-2S)-binding protein [Paenibacillus tarimensis]|uniref:(2Fe-2S)-binding protein n=1 Tax=Paenibacillus tarimensis TaxID=416012 RepID=UPI001F41BE7B|nr:(2Fe-2S)-binding protein [Paenibacillus tarimensis]MCF2944730.1 (2Fe-2S)-binding protein [Paenibacillus tarimensis]
MSKEQAAERLTAPVTELHVNGNRVTVCAEPSKRLLHVLRDDLLLTGTKRSCEIGRCGACMVLLDGRPVNACLAMLYQCSGSAVITVEGVAPQKSGELDPIQQAFLEEGGYQCGYCTPGMVISVKALLDFSPEPTDAEIVEALSGNICRCTGYGGILRAVRRAVELRRAERS